MIQITTKTVRQLALALVALGKHGDIQTTTEGHVGAPAKEETGRLTTCKIVAVALECRLGTGRIIRIPIAKLGFRPEKSGDMTAFYKIERDGTIAVHYLAKSGNQDLEGYRYFRCT